MNLLPYLNHHMPKASGRQRWKMGHNVLVMNNSNVNINGHNARHIAGHKNYETTWSLNQQPDWMPEPMLDCQCEAYQRWCKPWWWKAPTGGKPKLTSVWLDCYIRAHLSIPISRMKSPASEAPKLWPVPVMVVQWGQALLRWGLVTWKIWCTGSV